MTVTATIEVDRPAGEVFRYVTDASRFTEWQSGVVSGHMESDGVPAVGTKCVTTRRMGFVQRPVTSEVSHVDPPRTWGVRGVDGPVRARVDVTVDALGEGRARVAIDIDFTGRGIGRLLVPLLVVPQARREMPANLERLKARLET